MHLIKAGASRRSRLGGEETVRRFATPLAKKERVAPQIHRQGDVRPELIHEDIGVPAVDPRDDAPIEVDPSTAITRPRDRPTDSTSRPSPPSASSPPGSTRAVRSFSRIWLTFLATSRLPDFPPSLLTASMNIGALLCDGIGDAIFVQGEPAPGQSSAWPTTSSRPPAPASSRPITSPALPAGARSSTFRPPPSGSGRTAHLKGVKIAIMGCIVNGPGEMADADFGYVGGAPGRSTCTSARRP